MKEYIDKTNSLQVVNDEVKPYEKINVIPIPEGATNGDMIKVAFPYLEAEIESTYITCWIDEHRWFAPDYDWWNAPYKKQVIE
jgi:hypothetical protein